jgi:hypothetical protein
MPRFSGNENGKAESRRARGKTGSGAEQGTGLLQESGMKTGSLVGFALLAVLAASCGISGSSGPGEDTHKSDLEIRDVHVAPTDTSAVVTWNTTQQTVGTLEFGRNQGTLSNHLSSGLGGEHALTLAPLDPDTEYWFQITATNPLGPRAVTQPVSFRTLTSFDLSDSTAPVISGVRVVGITCSSATVLWNTDDRTHGTLYYGQSAAYDQTAAESDPTAYTRSHSLTLSALSEATTYHFRIQAVNRAGLAPTSPDQTFQTGELPVLEITPDTVRVTGSNDFTFDVTIRNVANLAAMSFMLAYDPEMVEIVGASAGSFWTEHGGLLPLLTEQEDPVRGRAQYALSWQITFQNGIAVGTLANGGGEVAVIHARPKGTGSSSSLRLIESEDGLATTRLLDHNRLPMQFRVHDGLVISQ